MKWFKGFIALLLFSLLATMAVLGRHYVNDITTTQHRINNSKMTPTILVPGSSASQERFNTLLKQLNKMGEKHSILKLTGEPPLPTHTLRGRGFLGRVQTY
ncbi:alpha/beta hydrolase [Streptococcus hyointestinalis]|uniref:alpha/beta hydrolase n=1 Tax=Streptococcus hyointestinalis TaxID=1337 RepID=UPI003D08E406